MGELVDLGSYRRRKQSREQGLLALSSTIEVVSPNPNTRVWITSHSSHWKRLFSVQDESPWFGAPPSEPPEPC